MKKKFYFGIISSLLLLFCFSTIVFAEPEKYQIGENVYCYVEDPQYNQYKTIVIEGTGDTYDYCYDGYDVSGKHKKPDILCHNPRYHNIYIKDGVTSLGDFLLKDVPKYNLVYVSKDLKRIGMMNLLAWGGDIDYNVFPNTMEVIENIGNETSKINFPNFVQCLPLEKVPGGFYTGENITHIVVSNKTKSIQYGAFEKLKNLELCEIPSSVIYIDDEAFWRNTENLTIKGYTGSVADTYAKQHNIKFESVGKVPSFNKVYSIGNYQYKLNPTRETMSIVGLSKKGKNIKSISTPSSVSIYGRKYKVDTIAKSAFYMNKNISKVTVGSNISYIEQYAFASCPKLRTVKIASSNLEEVQRRILYNNKKLTVQLPKNKYSKYKSMISKSGINKKTKYVKF